MAYKRPSPQPVVEGGTGDQSVTAYAVVCGGTTNTGALQTVSGVGTTGQVLTSQGASNLPIWAAGASGSSALVLLQTQSVSSVGSITFTSGFSTTYYNYLLVFDNLSTSGTAGIIEVQLSNNGGSSYLTSGYTNFLHIYTTAGGSTTGVGASQGFPLFYEPGSASGALTFANGTMQLLNLTNSGNPTGLTYAFGSYSGTLVGYQAFNSYASTLNVNAIKIVATSATNLSGTVSLYGYTH
jgi:hypothetical protein